MKQRIQIIHPFLLFVFIVFPVSSWGNTKDFQQRMQELISCLTEPRLSEADSLASLIDDNDIEQLDSLQKNYYYIKGMAKYGVVDDDKAIYYFEKARELYLKEGLYDNNFLNMTLFLCDCYLNRGDYNTPQSYLRKAIIRYVGQFETYPSYAVKLYTLLADVYEAKGDTIWSDRVHGEKIQLYLIKDYIQNNPNDTIGNHVLDDYKSNRYLIDQYYNLQGVYNEDYVAWAEYNGKNMEKIGVPKEAEWCYKYCIRLSGRHGIDFSDFVMHSYMDILELYVKDNNIDNFNTLFPQVLSYAKGDHTNYYNEFSISKIFGNLFSEQGNKQQAYNCFKRCLAYLDSGNHVEDEIEHKISICMSLMAICDDLGYYQEALNYHPFLESQLTKEDGEKYYNYKFNLFAALMGIEEYQKSLSVIEELESKKKQENDTLNQKYIEYCLLKGANLILLNKDIEAISIFNGLYDCLQSHSNDIVDLQGWVYSSLASGLMELGDYQKALTMLEKSAEVELNEYGQVSNSILNNISECRKHL